MADTKLLPCPFCGVRLSHEVDDGIDFYDHPTSVCILSGTEIAQDRLIEWNRRATPPSPNTAPKGGDGAVFEAAARIAASYGSGRPIVERRPNDRILGRWEGEQAASANIARMLLERAALASRPAEVDDEGLPPLPPLPQPAIQPYQLIGRAGSYTAEQYRQGQRDAVAADRARRGEPQQALAWALVSPKGGIKKVAITRASVESRMRRWLEEWPDNTPVIRPLVFGDSAPSHITNKEK